MATVELPQYDLYVAGANIAPASGRFYETVDPYTGEPWARVPDADERDVDRAVSVARAALEGEWGELTGFQRSRLMHRLADLVERDADRLAELESRDSGKLLREFAGQMQAISGWFRYFAGWADKLSGETLPPAQPNFVAFTLREPIGVVAAVVPWNSPLLLLTWKLAPALAAGCTMVVKPSDHTPVTALELAKLVTEAGVPDGVFNVITGDGPSAGKRLVRHPGVDKVAFTGSTATGIDVAEGATSHLARLTLELGGKSAQVVFPDADLAAAANGIVSGVFAATGQTCMAGSRLVAHRGRPRSADRAGRRAGAQDHPRQPAGASDRDGSARQRGAVREGHRHPAARTLPGGHRGLWRRSGDRARRLLRPTDDPDRRRPGFTRGARGDLRPGRRGDVVLGRGRGDRQGQRHRVRTRGIGVDARRHGARCASPSG